MSDTQPLPPLNDIQKEAIDFIENNFDKKINTLCATGVGSGKTRIACEIINKHLDKQDYALVCCPTVSVIKSIWSNTLKKFTKDFELLQSVNFKHNILGGYKRFNPMQSYVYCITYKMLISKTYHTANYIYFKNNPPSIIIFDEMHYLSNSEKNIKMTREGAKEIPASKKLGLTATPLVNRSEELEEAFNILNGINTTPTEKKDENGKPENDIKKNFLFHRPQEYSYTPCNQFILELPLSDDEYDTLQNIEQDSHNMFRVNSATQQLLITGKTSIGYFNYNCTNPTTKERVIKTILKKIPTSDKVLIFGDNINSLEYLKNCRWMQEYNPVLYHGQLDQEKQYDNYRKFTEDPYTRFFLATRQIAGEGLNLQIANHMIILSYGWTPKEIIQASGRIKRLGQEKDVFIYILKGKYENENNIETKQILTITKKNKEFNNTFRALDNIQSSKETEYQEELEYPKNTASLTEKKLLDFKKTSQATIDPFLSNDTLVNDIDKFIDSVQANYIKKYKIAHTIDCIIRKRNDPKATLLLSVEQFNNKYHNTIFILLQTDCDKLIERLRTIDYDNKNWPDIEQLCNFVCNDTLSGMQTYLNKIGIQNPPDFYYNSFHQIVHLFLQYLDSVSQ